jgi:hypothetical protein
VPTRLPFWLARLPGVLAGMEPGHRLADLGGSAPATGREVRTILNWLENHAPRLAALYYFAHNRLTGTRCYAQGCGWLLLAHTPRQLDRCYSTPLAIELTDRGWLAANGIDPDSEPVVPVSHAKPA